MRGEKGYHIFFIIGVFVCNFMAAQTNNLLDDWVVIPPASQLVNTIEQEGAQEYAAVQQAIRDQERAIARQNLPAWYAFVDALKVIPKGLGMVGDALRTLSRSSLYLDTTLRKILKQEEQKLSPEQQATFKQVRTHVSSITKQFAQRLKRETLWIKDPQTLQDTVSAIQLEYLAALQFIARLDAPNQFGQLSRDAQILLLLTYLREIRLEQSRAKYSPDALFQVWSELITDLTAELLNQRTKETSNGSKPINPYKARDAIVKSRASGSLHTEEKYTFVPARMTQCAAAQRIFMASLATPPSIPVSDETALRIGFAFSGGGYRAMTLTAGYMEALEQLKIAPLYLSTLSGSTWWLAPWLLSGKPIEMFNQSLAARIGNMDITQYALMGPKAEQAINAFHRNIILPKFAFDQPIGTVDLYGALLSQVLLGGSYTHHLSDQWQLVQDGKYPFPLYTTISMHAIGPENQKTYRYHWYEMNPLECENIDLGLAIPIWSFGRQFDGGMSLRTPGIPSYPYEQSLGYILGFCGSAYAIDFLKEAQHFVSGIAEELIKVTQKIVKARRLWPAQVANPWFGLPDFIVQRMFSNVQDADWLRNKELLTFVDAGIDFNLPIIPLLKKDRALDIIIIGDASAQIDKRVSIANEQYPLEFGKFLQHFDPSGTKYAIDPVYNQAPLIVYRPQSGIHLPVLIYINYEKNAGLISQARTAADVQLRTLVSQQRLDTFDPVNCVNKEYCSTFNFNYSQSEFQQLKAMGEFNVLANADTLRTIIATEYAKRSKQVLSSDAYKASQLAVAIYEGNTDLAQQYLNEGINVNILVKGIPGLFVHEAISPLMVAVLGYNSKLVAQLLEHGADPMQASSVSGITPLEAAKRIKKSDILELLQNSLSEEQLPIQAV